MLVAQRADPKSRSTHPQPATSGHRVCQSYAPSNCPPCLSGWIQERGIQENPEWARSTRLESSLGWSRLDRFLPSGARVRVCSFLSRSTTTVRGCPWLFLIALAQSLTVVTVYLSARITTSPACMPAVAAGEFG